MGVASTFTGSEKELMLLQMKLLRRKLLAPSAPAPVRPLTSSSLTGVWQNLPGKMIRLYRTWLFSS